MDPVFDMEVSADAVHQNNYYNFIHSGNSLRYYQGCLNTRSLIPASYCGSYINCWYGLGMEQSCPAGLLYSIRLHRCEYPHQVYCGDRFLRSKCCINK